MDQIIKNMNFKPILEKVEYKRLNLPTNNSTVNMRTWDEIKVERLRSDAVKVVVTRFIKPEPESLLSVEVKMGLEVLVNTSAYDALNDAEEYFKTTQVMQVLLTHIATIIANITMHGPIGPMVTAPVPMFPKA